MKTLQVLLIILMTITTFLLACVNEQSKANETKNKIEDSIKILTDKDVKEPIFTTEDFLNNTFYYFHKTDTGLVVVDWYDGGLHGIRMSENNWEEFGFEPYISIIDKIEVHSGYCIVYLKDNENSEGSYPYRIESVPGRPGHILINEVSMLVDSTMLHTVKFMKEAPYDIHEAWENEAQNQ